MKGRHHTLLWTAGRFYLHTPKHDLPADYPFINYPYLCRLCSLGFNLAEEGSTSSSLHLFPSWSFFIDILQTNFYRSYTMFYKLYTFYDFKNSLFSLGLPVLMRRKVVGTSQRLQQRRKGSCLQSDSDTRSFFIDLLTMSWSTDLQQLFLKNKPPLSRHTNTQTHRTGHIRHAQVTSLCACLIYYSSINTSWQPAQVKSIWGDALRQFDLSLASFLSGVFLT